MSIFILTSFTKLVKLVKQPESRVVQEGTGTVWYLIWGWCSNL